MTTIQDIKTAQANVAEVVRTLLTVQDRDVDWLADETGLDASVLRSEIVDATEPVSLMSAILYAEALGVTVVDLASPRVILSDLYPSMPDWATGVSRSDDPHDRDWVGFTREFPSGLLITAYPENDYAPTLYTGDMGHCDDEWTVDDARALIEELTAAIKIIKPNV